MSPKSQNKTDLPYTIYSEIHVQSVHQVLLDLFKKHIRDAYQVEYFEKIAGSDKLLIKLVRDFTKS